MHYLCGMCANQGGDSRCSFLDTLPFSWLSRPFSPPYKLVRCRLSTSTIGITLGSMGLFSGDAVSSHQCHVLRHALCSHFPCGFVSGAYVRNISPIIHRNSNYIALETLGYLEWIWNRRCLCRRRIPCTHDFSIFR